MPEWLYEEGIGEARAALVEDRLILEAQVEREEGGPRAGAIVAARLIMRADASGRAKVLLEGGDEALLLSPPSALAEGATLLVALTREALPEGGRWKPALARAAPIDAVAAPGPDLAQRIAATGHPMRRSTPVGPDAFETHGWSELLDEAATGVVARDAALLRISLTPAMTLIDVDGAGPAAALAVAGARLAGETIRRLDLAGSIGIDLPTLAGRADRKAAGAALDGVLPPPFERAQVNGFGLLHLVRPRRRPSLPERIAADRPLAAGLALLRRAERDGSGGCTLVAAPAVVAAIAARPGWTDALARRRGGAVALRPDPSLAISAGHVEPIPR